jgi:hypothetical protein
MKLGSSEQVSKLSALVKEKRRDTIIYVISVFSFYIAGFIFCYPANTENCALLSTENCRYLAN